MVKCKSIWDSPSKESPSKQYLQKRKKKKIAFFKKHYSAETLNEIESIFRITMERGIGPGPCLKCGADTELLDGLYGKFYGCVTFPECTGSRDYVKKKEEGQ